MKFSKYLTDHVILEWASEYINYKALKRLANVRNGVSEDSQRAEFLFSLETELQKVEQFYLRRLGAIERRNALIKQSMGSDLPYSTCDFATPRLFMSTSELLMSTNSVAQSDTLSVSLEGQSDVLPSVDRDGLLLEHVEECRISIVKLTQYASINLEGFRKILKKYDKKHDFKTDLSTSYYEPKVLGTKFAAYKKTLSDWSKVLGICASKLLLRVSGLESDTGLSDRKKLDTLREIRQIWNDIYALQVKAILENDDAVRLLEITKTLDLEKFHGELPDSASVKHKYFVRSSPSLPERTLAWLEREHALLLKYLLDGICLHQSVECLQLLIDSGLDISYAERWMNFSLIFKVLSGMPKRASVCGNVKEENLDHRAAQVIRVLLEHDATITWSDMRGRTIIHQAVFAGSRECLEILLTFKNPQKVQFQGVDHDGCSPLFFAVQNGFTDLCVLLMDFYDKEGLECILVAASSMTAGHSKVTGVVEPLILTCKLGHFDLLKAMIERQMNLDVVDIDGESALYHCAKRNHSKCLELLLQNRANPEICEKYDCWTPLFVAAAFGCAESVELLIKYGANRETLDNKGWTAYEHAMFRGNVELALTIKPSRSLCIPDASGVNTEQESKQTKEYGHMFLGSRKTIIFTLGHRSGPRSHKPPVELLDRPVVVGPLDLQLQVIPSNLALGEATILDLPLREQPREISFVISDGPKVNYSPWDEIRFDILRASVDATVEIMGRGSVMLESFVTEDGVPAINGSKKFVVPILERIHLEPMALVSFEVLIACPFVHPMTLGERPSRMYWKSVSKKVIGHRGLGANSTLSHPQIGENTVLSFIMAASLGAEYVEFDVQLTKDKVPVLYHDYLVSETGLDIPVSSLTLKQFLALRKRFNGNEKGGGLGPRFSIQDDTLVLPRWLKGTDSTRLDASYGRPVSKNMIIETPFATLSEAFHKVPKEIGFTVEVKYPTHDEIVEYGLQHTFEINEYCDRILSVVFGQAGDRPVLFFSFHPDVDNLLNLIDTFRSACCSV